MGEVKERFDEQLAHLDELTETTGSFVAAGMARLWPRLRHRDPSALPALLDSMLFAIEGGLPGAPDEALALRTAARALDVASGAVQRWARRRAEARMRREVQAIVRLANDQLDASALETLRLLEALVPPIDVAAILVHELEKQGPSPALEEAVLGILEKTSEPLPDELDDWQLIHRTVRVLGGHTR